ncbi:MAG: hypothetical protein QMD04_06525 [Anaerolineales bacterium]|nr:hypothetical protein [Anaerolineales bacterium]
MRTPAGSECKYFYGDYYRGRQQEECRLLNTSAAHWTRDLCRTCPIPSITRANACEFMVLRAEVTRPVMAVFQRRVQVKAFCEKTQQEVAEAHIGCGECHPLPSVFEVK